MYLVPGKGKDILLGLVAQQNVLPYPLLADETAISSPKSTATSQKPTAVSAKVIALPGSPYEGAAPIGYQRMDLSAAFGSIVPVIRSISSGTLHSMLPEIGRKLGMFLDPIDFDDVDYSGLGELQEAFVRIRASATSLSYTGSFIIKFTRIRPALLTATPTGDLDRTRFPGSTGGNKKQVDTFTWARDWTEFYSAVQKHSVLNVAGNPAALVTLMNSLGFSTWPTGINFPTYDYPTSAVPQANPTYDRVIVQSVVNPTIVNDLAYEGTAYFHYNLT
jgi:hypothetical protein